MPVAEPFDPLALLIEATTGFELPQVTDVVRFCVLESLYVPTAVNCSVVPAAMLGLTGVTAIETKVAAVTVKVTAGELTALSAAVTDVAPGVSVVARPLDPAALLIDATAGFDDIQMTVVVRFWVELSV